VPVATGRSRRVPRTAVLALGAGAVLLAPPARAQDEPSLRAIGHASLGLVSDERRYVAWVDDDDGRMRLRDTRRRRTVLGAAPGGGCALIDVYGTTALLSCGSTGAVQARTFDFATEMFGSVAAPPKPVDGYVAIGRRWIMATDSSIRAADVYVSRRTGRVVYRSGDESEPLSDLDSATLERLPMYPKLTQRPAGERSVLELRRSARAGPCGSAPVQTPASADRRPAAAASGSPGRRSAPGEPLMAPAPPSPNREPRRGHVWPCRPGTASSWRARAARSPTRPMSSSRSSGATSADLPSHRGVQSEPTGYFGPHGR